MARLTIFALLLLAGSACSAQNRIVGGWPASIQEWNFIVQSDSVFWQTRWSQSCAANIITTNHVLSAASCYTLEPRFYRIRAGSVYRNIGGTIHQIQWYLNHPSYQHGAGFEGNINIMRLTTPLVYSPVVGPGTIVAPNQQLPDGAAVRYAGWGATTHGGSWSSVLLETQVYSFNNTLCAQVYAGSNPAQNVTAHMICTFYPGRDACNGDVGGPLTFGPILVGITSWSQGCASNTHPGVNTAVSPYTQWIVANV